MVNDTNFYKKGNDLVKNKCHYPSLTHVASPTRRRLSDMILIPTQLAQDCSIPEVAQVKSGAPVGLHLHITAGF